MIDTDNRPSWEAYEGKNFDIMVDIETLGTAPGSAIVAIGAVRFDRDTLEVAPSHEWYSEFFIRIDPKSAVDAGLTMDPDTVVWWLGQSEAARHNTFHISKKPYPLAEDKPSHINPALLAFEEWVKRRSLNNDGSYRPEIWGNGADFDNVLLACAYKACQLKMPWSYRDHRCYRTVKSFHPDIPFVNHGIAHGALDDARAQAEHLMLMLRKQRAAEEARLLNAASLLPLSARLKAYGVDADAALAAMEKDSGQ